MKKKSRFKRMIVAALAALLALPVLAGYAPQSVKQSFAALYPGIDTTQVIWSDDGGYYLAQFQDDGFAARAWFNNQAQCVMVQTDVQTLDRVPADVYNAFAMGDYGNYTVRNVTYVEFPKWQPIYVVLVGEPNLEGAYQLFFTPYGELLRERSTVGVDQPLGIATFF